MPAQPPYPSWQVPPAMVNHTKPIYGFYVTYGQRFMFQHFAALHVAKHFIDLMLQGDEYHRTDDFTILSERGVTIRMENPKGRRGPSMLDEVLNHSHTKDEQAFVFPEQFLNTYRPFPNSPFLSHKSTQEPQQPSNDETRDTPSEKPAKRAQRAPSAPRTAPKQRPEGLVSIATIAADLKVDPKQARQALRKANVAKPEHGWSFPPAEVAAITKAIKDNLK